MDFCWVTLHVTDLEKSLEFYRDLIGLSVSGRFSAGPDVEIAMLGQTDKPKIELMCNRREQSRPQSQGISIGFEVESLEQAMELVKGKGIEIEAGPLSPAPHVRFCFVRDPDGFQVQLVENR